MGAGRFDADSRREEQIGRVAVLPAHCPSQFGPDASNSLIEFRSVVDAVRFAVEVQNGMAERSA